MNATEFHNIVNSYASGTIKRGRQHVATFHKCDSITKEAMKHLETHDHIKVVSIQSQYAPELKRFAVVCLTQAERKRAKQWGVPTKEHVAKIVASVPHI